MAADSPSYQMSDSMESVNEEPWQGSFLHRLARNGDYETIQRLLKRKDIRRKINDLDGDHLTPLHYAARYNHFEAARILVDNGADILAHDRDGASALHYATRRKPLTQEKVKDSVSVLCLLAAGGKNVINYKDKYGSTPLHFCAMRGNDVAAATLLRLDGSDANVTDIQGDTPLHIAAIYGHLTIAKILVEGGADPIIADKEDITALHLAAMEGKTEMIKLIMDQISDQEMRKKMVAMVDKDGNTALHLAVENGNFEAAKMLMEEYGSNVHRTCRMETKNITALHLAATSGKVSLVELLIRNGSRLDMQDIELQTPLHKAAIANNRDATEALLQKGSKYIDYRDKNGNTALLLASRHGSAETLQLLLEKGSNVCVEDTQDRNAIYIAVENNHSRPLQILLKHIKTRPDSKILVNADDPFGNCPIHIASKNGFTEIVEDLLESGAELLRKNDDEMTPFLLAAENGHKETVTLLLEQDPDLVYDEDEASNSGLHLAARNGHADVAKVLIKKHTDTVARNAELWTPLDCAACAGHLSVVEILLNNGVDVDPVGRDKRTPLHWAAERGHGSVVSALLKAGADLSFKDHFKQNALDIAIEKGHDKAAMAIVNSENWYKAFRNTTPSRRKKGRMTTPIRKLIYTMPDVAKAALDRCMYPSKHSSEDEDFYITFQYEIIDDTYVMAHWCDDEKPDRPAAPTYDSDGCLLSSAEPYSKSSDRVKNMHPLMAMAKQEHESLLTHPLVLSLLANKWRTARIMYFLYLFIFAFFLSMLTSYLMIAKAPYKARLEINDTACAASKDPYLMQSDFEKVTKYIIWVFAGFGIFLEVFQLFQVKSHYLEPVNIIDWFTYVSAIVVTLDITKCGLRTDWQWQMSAVSLFIAWMNLLLFLRRLPFFGLYVVMIIDILWTFIKFFIVFFLFIVAFALGFYLLLENQIAFRDPSYSIIKTTVMMIGEFEYDAIFNSGLEEPNNPIKSLNYPALSYVFFYFFALLMSIIVMNLLTGLAVDDVSALQEKAKIRKLAMQIDLALDVELALPGPIRRARSMVLQFEKFYPNKGAESVWKAMTSSMSDLVAGGSDNPEMDVARTLLGPQVNDEETKSSEIEDLETRMKKDLKKTRGEIKNLNNKIARLEGKLDDILEAIQSRR